MNHAYADLAHALLDAHLAQPGATPHDAFAAIAPVAVLDRLLRAGEDVERTVPTVLAAIQGATGARSCRLLLREPDGSVTRLNADGSPGRGAALPALAGVSAEAEAAGAATCFAAEDLPRMVPAVDWEDARPPRALLAAPLPGGAGVLQLFDPVHGFTPASVAAAAATAEALHHLLQGQAAGAALAHAPQSTTTADALALLRRILAVALRILAADRGWILLHEPGDGPGLLRSRVADGLGGFELRLSAAHGIAATVFRDGLTINSPDAYADPRFSPALDRLLGYRTRTVLCVPIDAADGSRLGVLEVVNRRDGPFTIADEENAKALAAQAGVSVEHAALFDRLTRMEAANESMLRNLSNGVLTLDGKATIGFVNAAAAAMLRRDEAALLGRPLAAVFDALNGWVLDALEDVRATGAEKRLPNSELFVSETDEWVPVNLSILPLNDGDGRMVGAMLVLEDLQREQELRRTMSRYVASDVIDRVLTGDGALLSGNIQPASILFSDIRGFSSLSEMLGAQGTVSLLNGYFSYMEDVVANRSGIIDKYIGDAVMAVFGSPFPGPHDAENTVQAASDMLQVLAMFNAGRAGAGEPPVRIGIGLASGPVLVGNIGSPKRMDFTVIGDPVNLASRLEGATKTYGADILMDAPTRAGAAPGRTFRLLDVVRVVGQEQPTELWELLDHRTAQWGDGLHDALGLHAEALQHYRAGDWSRAAALFGQAAALNPHDKAARLLAERCAGFARQPPAEWDGAFSLLSK